MATEGNEGLGFKAALPTDLQNHELITPFKETKDLASSYVTLHGQNKELETKFADTGKKVSEYEGRLKNALFIPEADAKEDAIKEFNGKIDGYLKEKVLKDYILKPKENSTPEEKAAYYKAIGRPDKPEDYKFETFTPPKGSESMYDPTMETWFRNTALALNLTNEQAAGLYKAYGEGFTDRVNKLQLAQTQKKETDIAALKKSWGPKFDENLALMDRAYAKFSGQKFKEKIDAIGFSNDPDLAEVFVQIGKAIADDTTVLGGRVNGQEPREPGVMRYPSMEEKAA
jgi:hypothetical protein